MLLECTESITFILQILFVDDSASLYIIIQNMTCLFHLNMLSCKYYVDISVNYEK